MKILFADIDTILSLDNMEELAFLPTKYDHKVKHLIKWNILFSEQYDTSKHVT